MTDNVIAFARVREKPHKSSVYGMKRSVALREIEASVKVKRSNFRQLFFNEFLPRLYGPLGQR